MVKTAVIIVLASVVFYATGVNARMSSTHNSEGVELSSREDNKCRLLKNAILEEEPYQCEGEIFPFKDLIKSGYIAEFAGWTSTPGRKNKRQLTLNCPCGTKQKLYKWSSVNKKYEAVPSDCLALNAFCTTKQICEDIAKVEDNDKDKNNDSGKIGNKKHGKMGDNDEDIEDILIVSDDKDIVRVCKTIGVWNLQLSDCAYAYPPLDYAFIKGHLPNDPSVPADPYDVSKTDRLVEDEIAHPFPYIFRCVRCDGCNCPSCGC